jgi:hypothetical protein
MRLPLPMSLDHINVYALADDGMTAGPWSTAALHQGLDRGWETALAGPLGGKPVKRVICTHMHPDHLGLAGWLCEGSGVPLMMSRLEYVTARMLVADTGQRRPRARSSSAPRAGTTPGSMAGASEFGRFGKGVYPLPQSYQRLTEGDDIEIGGETGASSSARAIARSTSVCGENRRRGPVRRPDPAAHLVQCFGLADGADAGSAGRLAEFAGEAAGGLPEDTFVLPSHGEVFTGVHTRLEALQKGHQTGLTRLERALREPRRAIDVFPACSPAPSATASSAWPPARAWPT